ncbi:hemolysin family protein [Methylosinus sp. Sm6]|uniref:hemolysin family protein n=1 Tax=Methylosinus sp. Sm6 TaxID=2866948 RepID=UPI001C99780B|nr:hemolysin family protein [Methylosinus sp. Sm6]MBY6242075.1 hemolysin family protein [Methylosinus sp. Sm6]
MSRIDNGEHAGSRRGEPRIGIVDRLRALIGFGSASVREDIEEALEDASGDVTPHERVLLKNVLALHDLRVADAMVPRADIVAVGQDATLGETLALFRNAGHSRLPVYFDTLDDPRGMIHIRDFVDYLASLAERAEPATAGAPAEAGEHAPTASLAAIDFSAPLSTIDVLKPVLYVPPSMPALDLLVKMQATHTHLALVIDEYGGTHGLATMEDIVEMIVGDIEDEHDVDEEPRIETVSEGVYMVDAKADLEEVSRRLGVDFGPEDTGAEVTTLGGLVASLAGHVPMRGEIVPAPIEGWEFEIVEADPRRVGRLLVHAPK